MSKSVPAISAPSDRWEAWDSFLEAQLVPGFMQSSWWADFRATCGFEHFGVVLRERQTIVGGALVQKFFHASEECFYYIQDGPVIATADDDVEVEVLEAILEGINNERQSESRTVSHLRI